MGNNEQQKYEEKLKAFNFSAIMMLAILALAVVGNLVDDYLVDRIVEPAILTIELGECGPSEFENPDFVEAKNAQFY
jgi:hypothetical protein